VARDIHEIGGITTIEHREPGIEPQVIRVPS
jgi:hypothetical protein